MLIFLLANLQNAFA